VSPRTEQTGPGLDHRAAQAIEREDGLAGAATDVRDQLDLAGVQLPLDGALDRPEPLQYGRRGVDLPSRDRIDEKQLLLDADRERRLRAKGVTDPLV